MTFWMNCCDSPVDACHCDRDGIPDGPVCVDCGVTCPDGEAVEAFGDVRCRDCANDLAEQTREEATAVERISR